MHWEQSHSRLYFQANWLTMLAFSLVSVECQTAAIAQFPRTPEERFQSGVASLGTLETFKVSDGVTAKVALTLLVPADENCYGFRVLRISEHGDVQVSTAVPNALGVGRNMSSMAPKQINALPGDLEKIFAEIPPLPEQTPPARRLFVRHKSGPGFLSYTLDRQSLPAPVRQCLGDLLPVGLWREFGVPVPTVASQIVARPAEQHPLRMHGRFSVSPDRKNITIVDGLGKVYLVRADTEVATELQPCKDLAVEGRVVDCSFLNNTELVVVTTEPAQVIRFDVALNEVVGRSSVESVERIDRIWMTPGLTRLMGSTPNGLVAFGADGKRLPLPEEAAAAKACFTDLTGKTSLIAAADQAVWILREGQMSQRLECEGDLRDAMFSPSGNFAALITVKQRIRLSIWNCKTGERTADLSMYQLSDKGWPTEISGRIICWTADEKYLIGATSTGKFRGGEELQIWDLIAQRHAGRVPGSNKSILPGGGFIRQNETLIFATEDGQIRKLNWPETLRTIAISK